MRNNVIIIAGFVIVVLAFTVVGPTFIVPGTGMTFGRGMMNGTWTNGMMGGLAVFGVLVIGAVLSMLWLGRRPGLAQLVTPGHESPLDVLKMRYAKGEITKEQLEKMQLTINP